MGRLSLRVQLQLLSLVEVTRRMKLALKWLLQTGV